MKLAQLFPIHNCVINGYSLIENVFGANFVVYDATGSMLTTAKNTKLLYRAQELAENLQLYDVKGLAYVLAQLREEADVLHQEEYERCVWREQQLARNIDNDFSVMASSHG